MILFNNRGINVNNGTSEPDYLKQTKYRILYNNSNCSDFGYENDIYLYCVLDTTDRKSNICQGDSGGPTMHLNDGKWYLFGLTSFVLLTKDGLCDSTRPSFLTTVPLYVNKTNGTNQIIYPGVWVKSFDEFVNNGNFLTINYLLFSTFITFSIVFKL